MAKVRVWTTLFCPPATAALDAMRFHSSTAFVPWAWLGAAHKTDSATTKADSVVHASRARRYGRADGARALTRRAVES